jgi:CRP-like cAMP-binding protein
MERQTGLSKLIAEGSAGTASGRGQRPLGRHAVDMLAEIPLFASLSRRQLGKIADAASAKRYAPHSVLVLKGKPAEAFYVVLDGRVRVAAQGRKVELGSGDFFGEMALIDGEPRSASVVAIAEVYALTIPRAKFLKVLESEPKIALAIMATLTRRLRDVQSAATL